ncbi:MAG: tRNA pseudouridine(38-40) synthase TruA [Myxococcales bacterium]|nr:tRNA pseudouridine(38-40) synthase TruA [Myxococcales bacterium]
MDEDLDRSPQTVVLELAYDGARFHGFTHQPGQPTVAGELLRAIQVLDVGVIRVRVASRTDAGVHARTQLVAFDTRRSMSMRSWALALNQNLAHTIAVRAAFAAPSGYHPRFEVAQKRYRYLIHAGRVREPHWHKRAWHLRVLSSLDDDAVLRMDAELALARGTHDFSAFASAKDQREHTVRTLLHTEVSRLGFWGADMLALEVTGDGFLHNMVRILVGTVVDVACRRIAPGAIGRALASNDRRDAGQTAPPEGLYLEELWTRTDLDPTSDHWP